MAEIKIGVITASDRASAGIYEDISGMAIQETMRDYLISEFEIVYRCIPDEQDVIEATMKELCDEAGCCLVVTTGGTGPALRDVTPEATENVCDARIWRTNASGKFTICSNGNSLPPNSWNQRKITYY
jgi:molybdopterin adenylyltransferase